MGGIVSDIATALSFCTRLPVGRNRDISLAQAAWALPVAGAVIGVLGALAYWLAVALGLPPFVSASLAVAATLLVTGALHEDGLADTADGFGGGATRERKLEIMRDSRSGTYGALALIVSALLRVGALASLPGAGAAASALIAAHVGARAFLPIVMLGMPNARGDGLAAGAGTPSSRSAGIAIALGVLVLMFCLGPGPALIAALLAGLTALIVARLALRQIGGQTGDVLGAIEQISEIAILLVAAAAL